MATFFRHPMAPLTLLLAAMPVQAAQPQRPGPDFSRFAARAAARQITAGIDDQDRVTLRGTVPGAVRSSEAVGLLEPGFSMDRMILSLKASPEAQARLDQLSQAQQDPKSPYFHQWLTPDQYGAMFGPSQADMDAILGWLMGQGFTIDGVSAGRQAITFSGTAAQVQRAFRAPLKTFQVDGVLRHANSADLTLPSALAGAVGGVVSLTDIPRKAMNTGFKPLPEAEAARLGNLAYKQPTYTGGGSSHYLAAGDFATIYNLKPLYAAGIDGTGTTIAIVGRTNINVSDVTYFRSFMGLPANDPAVILNGADPGSNDSGEVGEALLDVEWSGAVAKNATVKFIATKTTSTTDGVDASAQYIVDHANTLGATVMSTSFGACESGMGTAENTFYNNLWQQAATEGITAFVSAGDAGAAGCNSGSDTTGSGAAVSGLASTPFNVCVGGTEFNEGGSPATYWAASNGAGNASALSYIPETVWNESKGVRDPSGGAGSGLWATGGGVSTVYAKPSWQVAPGVPSDGKRDCPDVSLAAAGYDGYLVVQGHTSTVSGLASVGGTSASSPAFAGIMALIVQKMGGTGQGEANTRFYKLGKAQYGSAGTAVFHDTTTGSNTVLGVTGFNAGTGYDLATGLGSVDAEALVNNWTEANLAITPKTPTTVNVGGTVTFTATSNLTPNTVTWGSDGGSFSAATTAGDGVATTVYTAPAAIGSAQANMTVTATGSDGTTTANVLVAVIDPAQVTLAVSPNNGNPNTARTLLTGKTLSFTATVNAGTVHWITTGGTLSSASGTSTTLTAPAAAGDITVTATSTANPALKTAVTLHVKNLDVNGDASVDVRDFLAIAGAYGSTTTPAADLDGSGTVDDGDLAVFLNAF